MKYSMVMKWLVIYIAYIHVTESCEHFICFVNSTNKICVKMFTFIFELWNVVKVIYIYTPYYTAIKCINILFCIFIFNFLFYLSFGLNMYYKKKQIIIWGKRSFLINFLKEYFINTFTFLWIHMTKKVKLISFIW